MWRDRRGVVAMEFAVVASVLVVILVLVLEVGLMSWTRAALQTAAALTARCAAVGSTDCPSATNYAVTAVQNWLYANVVTAANVTVQTNVACNGATGKYTVVTITATNWIGAVLPPGLSRPTLTASACYLSAL
jgi:Flp pilus assembly protein TadG